MKELMNEWVSEGLDYFDIMDKLTARLPLGESSESYSDYVIETIEISKIKARRSTSEQIGEYFTELRGFDWFYDYSDDHSVWTRGNEKKKILDAKRYESEDFYRMHKEFYRWSRGQRSLPTLQEFISH